MPDNINPEILQALQQREALREGYQKVAKAFEKTRSTLPEGYDTTTFGEGDGVPIKISSKNIGRERK